MKYYGSIMGNYSVFGLTHEHALALLIKQINKKKYFKHYLQMHFKFCLWFYAI